MWVRRVHNIILRYLQLKSRQLLWIHSDISPDIFQGGWHKAFRRMSRATDMCVLRNSPSGKSPQTTQSSVQSLKAAWEHWQKVTKTKSGIFRQDCDGAVCRTRDDRRGRAAVERLHTEMAHPNICGSLSAAVTQSSTNHSLTGNSFFSISATLWLYYHSCCHGAEVKRAAPVSCSEKLLIVNLGFRNQAVDACEDAPLKIKPLVSSCYSLILWPAASIGSCACFRTSQLEGNRGRRRNHSLPLCSFVKSAANKCFSESGPVVKPPRPVCTLWFWFVVSTEALHPPTPHSGPDQPMPGGPRPVDICSQPHMWLEPTQAHSWEEGTPRRCTHRASPRRTHWEERIWAKNLSSASGPRWQKNNKRQHRAWFSYRSGCYEISFSFVKRKNLLFLLNAT